MPQIFSNFVFKSTEPNFERDSFDTLDDMKKMPKDFMDVGHIVYCKGEKAHYVYMGENNEKYPKNVDSGYFYPLTTLIANEINEKNSLHTFEININDIKDAIKNTNDNIQVACEEFNDKINEVNADIPRYMSDLTNNINCLTPENSSPISENELTPDTLVYLAVNNNGNMVWKHISLQQLSNYLNGLTYAGYMDDDFGIHVPDNLIGTYSLVYEDEFGNILENFEPLTSNYKL
jgi:hypothetical protein